MPRYFALISHHISNGRTAFYNKAQRRRRILSIGWGEVNPIGSTRGRIKRDIIDHYDPAALNVSNGVYSLELFSGLMVGDIVFVRGESAIIDVVIVVGSPFYRYGQGHSGPNDYCMKVEFTPLFGKYRFTLPISRIPDKARKVLVFSSGRSRTMKGISEAIALSLIKEIAVLLDSEN